MKVPARLFKDLAELRATARWPHWSRAAALVHAAALAALMRPEPVHAVILFSGAAVLMGIWRRDGAGISRKPASSRNAGLEEVRGALHSSEIVIDTEAQHADAAHPASVTDLPTHSPRQPPAKPAEFDDMLAHLSHDLRTPLNALIGFADLMDAETFGPVGHPRYREYLGHIRSSGAYLLQSAENTLAVAELLAATRGAPERNTFRLDQCLREACASLPALVDRAGGPIAISNASECDIVGDRRVFQRAVSALVAEADAVSAGCGPITAIVRHETGKVHLTITAPHVARRATAGMSPRLALAKLLFNAVDLPFHEDVALGENGARWNCTVTLEDAAQPDAVRGGIFSAARNASPVYA